MNRSCSCSCSHSTGLSANHTTPLHTQQFQNQTYLGSKGNKLLWLPIKQRPTAMQEWLDINWDEALLLMKQLGFRNCAYWAKLSEVDIAVKPLLDKLMVDYVCTMMQKEKKPVQCVSCNANHSRIQGFFTPPLGCFFLFQQRESLTHHHIL